MTYSKATLTIILFEQEDIITTSGCVPGWRKQAWNYYDPAVGTVWVETDDMVWDDCSPSEPIVNIPSETFGN